MQAIIYTFDMQCHWSHLLDTHKSIQHIDCNRLKKKIRMHILSIKGSKANLGNLRLVWSVGFFFFFFFASNKKNFNVEGGQHFNCLPRTYLNTYLLHSSVFLVFLYNRLHCMLQNIPVWEQHIFWSTTKENSKNKLEHLEKQHLQKGIYAC